MSLNEFRAKVQEYRRVVGIAQQQLARELGLHPTALSHKLHETDGMRLTHTEVKSIVKLMARWQAIYRHDEAVELLQLMNLKPTAFSDAEWSSPPLNSLEKDVPPLSAATVSVQGDQGGLPALMTRLIGRDALVESLCERLSDSNVRLITLTGPGGVGKTRLAIAVARRMQQHFTDGIVYVPLAGLGDWALVVPEIAHRLQIKAASSGKPLIEAIKESLSQRHTLLVLDNFEHVIQAAPIVGELLETTNRLTIVITSRTVLNIYGEHQVRVPPLELPSLRDLDTVENLKQQPAIALFVTRSQAARSDFTLTEANARTVAEICVRLDGLPLALELAAARCRLFSPAALLQRLDQPLKLLSGGATNLSLRQRTLQDTIAWSYALLDSAEQNLFCTISAFPSGCTVEMLEAIFVLPSWRDLLDCLTSLLDKSLIDQYETADGEVRFTMLETLREFGFELLFESGEMDALRERQARYFSLWVPAIAPGLRDETQVHTADRIEAEHDNLRVVLAWMLVHQPAACVRLCGHLAYFWNLRGYVVEGDRWLRHALEYPLPVDASRSDQVDYARALRGEGMLALLLADHDRAALRLETALQLSISADDPVGHAATLLSLGDLTWERSDLALAQHYYEESVAIAQQFGDKQQQATALNNLGALLWLRDDLVMATAHLSAALDLWRALKHKRGIAHTLSNLGIVSVKQQQFERALVYYGESLVLLRELGDERSTAVTLNNMGEVALQKGDYVEAQRLYEETLSIHRRVNYARGIGLALTNRGSALLFQGLPGEALASLREALVILRDLGDQEKLALALEIIGVTLLRMREIPGALVHHREALILSRDMDDLQGVASSLACIAAVIAVDGAVLRAARLWGAALALWETSGALMLPLDRQRFEPELAAARAASEPSAFEAAWRAGLAMDMQSMIAEALRDE